MPQIPHRLLGATIAVALGTISLAPAAFAQSAMSSMPGMDHMAMPANQTAMPVAGPNQVIINNFAFGPATLTVKRGTTVTWINRDGDAHTVTATVTAVGTKPLFGSNPLDTGDSFSFTFNQPGTYAYFCKIHPTMKGVVVVQ